MQISTLIKKLQYIKRKFGDQEISFLDEESGPCEPVIELDHENPGSFVITTNFERIEHYPIPSVELEKLIRGNVNDK